MRTNCVRMEHIESLPISAVNKNEDPLEDDDAELAMETESSSSVSLCRSESTSSSIPSER
jgi:hypothetical protein